MWDQIMLSCSTLVIQGNLTQFHMIPTQESIPKVLANTPQHLLEEVTYQNCINAVVDIHDFLTLANFLSHSRVRANVLVIGVGDEELRRRAKKMRFDVYTVQFGCNGNPVVDFAHYVFGIDGKALDRSLRGAYIFPVWGPPQTGPPDTAKIMLMMEAPLNLELTFVAGRGGNGAMTLVQSNKADVVTYLPSFDWVTYVQGFEVSPAVRDRSIGFLRPYPKLVSSDSTLVYPFGLDVWLGLLVTTIMVWMCLVFTEGLFRPNATICFEAASLSISMLLMESMPTKWFSRPRLQVIKPSVGIWFLCQMILAYSYKSNLLSHLIKTDFEPHPETLQDILDMKKAVYVPYRRSITEKLRTSPVKIHQQIFKESVLKRGGIHNFSALQWPPKHLAKDYDKGNMIGFGYSDIMNFYEHKSEMGKEYIYSTSAGYYYSLKLPLTNELNMGLLNLNEGGLTTETSFTSDSGATIRKDTETSKEVSLSLDHLLPSFILLLMLMGFGVISFISEVTIVLSQTKTLRQKMGRMRRRGLRRIRQAAWSELHNIR